MMLQEGRDAVNPFQIVEARRSSGVGQRDLARVLGLAPQRLSELERGHVPVPQDFEVRVRSALVVILQSRLAAVGRG